MSHQSFVPALDVFWPDGRLVGRVLSPGPTYFAYADSWLASGHNLSPLSVPFSSTPFRHRINGAGVSWRWTSRVWTYDPHP